jgi:hypothetical protein
MARSEARLQFGIWQGLSGLSRDAKLLYAVLLTEPTINHAGVGAVRIDRWAAKAGMSTDEVAEALAELAREPQVIVDSETHEVLVRTLIRNDGVADQPYVLKGALREALQTDSPILRRWLASELRKLPPKRPDGVSKAGKPVIYPDPHAVADELDPGGPPSVSGKSPESLSEASSVITETLPEAARGEGSGKAFGSLRGGGGGGGGGSSSVTTQVTRSKDEDGARDETITLSQTNQDLAAKAVALVIGNSRPKAVREGLVRRAVLLLDDGALPIDLTTALNAWRNTEDARVTWLDHKVADAASQREARERPPKPSRPSTTDQRVADILALRDEISGGKSATVSDLFAIKGGAA